MDCNPQGSSVPGILQARTLEWFAMSSSGGAFLPQGLNPRLLTPPASTGGFFTTSTTWGAQGASPGVKISKC